MKRVLFVFTMMLAFVAANAQTGVFTSDQVLKDGATLIDKEIQITGTVTHVCHSSGKKVFLAGADEEKTIQVFAGGDIQKFAPELIDSKMKATGIVCEHRISKETIAKQEAKIAAELEKEDCMNIERCNNVMSNYQNMKQWMAENGKDYYPVYYVKATKYEILK